MSRGNKWIDLGNSIVCNQSGTVDKYEWKDNKWSQINSSNTNPLALCYIPKDKLDRLEIKPMVDRKVYDVTLGTAIPSAAVGGAALVPLITKITSYFV